VKFPARTRAHPSPPVAGLQPQTDVAARPLDLRELLDNLSKMLQRVIGEHINLRIQCAKIFRPCWPSGQLEQIVINLAVNARDAMPRGGPLTIAAELVVIDAKYQKREPDAVVGLLCVECRPMKQRMSETVRPQNL